MVDFHSHILPEMDDGSRSVEESLRMLEESARQGITHIAATPHFDPLENSPEQFLARRERASARLCAFWHPELPQILLGAEVCYFAGMSRTRELKSLRLEGTRLLLLEMPVQTWSERMVLEIISLHSRPGFTVMLAHIERYLRLQKRAVWDELLKAGVLMQSNASFFLRWHTRRRASRMLESGRIHVLGSDCHNMTARPPRLGEAVKILDEGERRELERRSRRLMGVEELPH